MIRQELNPETFRLDEKQIKEKRQVRDKGVPLSYHHGKAVSSLVDDCQTMHPPPALLLRLERERTEGRKREKFYIYIDVTHTHIHKTCIQWFHPGTVHSRHPDCQGILLR